MRFSDLPLIRDIDWFIRCKQIERSRRELEAYCRIHVPVLEYARKLRQQNERSLRPVVRVVYDFTEV